MAGTVLHRYAFLKSVITPGKRLLTEGPSSLGLPLADDGMGTLRAYTDATREIMRVVAESRHDEKPVFQAILECSRNLCRVDLCSLLMVTEDPNSLLLAATSGHTPIAFEAGVTTFPVGSNQNLAVAYREKRTIHTEDMRDTELYRAGDPTRRMIVDKEGMRSQLVIPLNSGDTPMGVFVLHRQRVEVFTDPEITLLETFADQAVIAIENARQFRELQTRLEREAATREILSVISQSPDDEQPVFDVILENAARLCNSPNAVLSMVDDAREYIVLKAAWGDRYKGLQEGFKVPLSNDNVPALAIRQAKAAQIEGLADTDLYREGDPTRRRLVDEEGVRTLLAVPLITGGEAIGTISLHRREAGPFSDDQIALLETFAAQAVIAIENVRQFRELQTRLEREAATREILSVISQHQDDEQPVFDVILENAAKLCGSPNAVLSLVDDAREFIINRAAWGEMNNEVDFGLKVPLDGDNVAGQAVREKRVVQIDPELFIRAVGRRDVMRIGSAV